LGTGLGSFNRLLPVAPGGARGYMLPVELPADLQARVFAHVFRRGMGLGALRPVRRSRGIRF
jgi:hypothetical protein